MIHTEKVWEVRGLISFRKFLILWLLVAMIMPTMGYAASGGTPGPNSSLVVPTAVVHGNGNEGTVKISEAGTDVIPDNDPHVQCQFFVLISGLTNTGTYVVTEQGGLNGQDNGAQVLSGSFSGTVIGPVSLPAGQYKVEVTDTDGHHAKSKVFRVTPCATATPTVTETTTVTPTETVTSVPPTETPTATNTATVVTTATSTATSVPTATSTSVPTNTSTSVPSATSTSTALVAPTATNVPVATATNTAVPATSTPTETNTAVAPTATSTEVPPTATNTSVPTETNTAVPPTETNTPITGGGAAPPTRTATPRPTNTSRPTATRTPTARPTNTPMPAGVPAATNTPMPTATATPRATATSTPQPTATNTPRPTSTPQATATSTPRPTATPRPVRRHPTTGRAEAPVTGFAPVTAASYANPATYATMRIAGHTYAVKPAAYPTILLQNVFTVDSDYQNLGRSGLTYAFAHDDLQSGVGTSLYGLHRGDVIFVQRGSHHYRYVVTSNVTVAPTNVAALTRHYSRSTLVLVTCTPVGVDTSRVVVTAQLR